MSDETLVPPGGVSLTLTSTDGLLELARDAEAHGRNRQADIARLESALEPDGVHLLVFEMVHNYAGGRPVEAHLRTQWKIRVREEEKAGDLRLDVSFSALERWGVAYAAGSLGLTKATVLEGLRKAYPVGLGEPDAE